jgi:spermidine synthase
MFQEKAFVALHQRLKEIFGSSSAYVGLFFAPTYPSGMWSIQMAKKGDFHPIRDLNSDKADTFAKKHNLHYYESNVHKGAFALPRFVQKMLMA